MKFTLHRDHVLASTTGHSIRFVKGQPAYVPLALRREAISIGAVPSDDSAYEEVKAPAPTAPTDPVERKSAILKALAVMVERNRREDFGASGAPHVKAVEAELGWQIDAQERTDCWNEYLQGGAE